MPDDTGMDQVQSDLKALKGLYGLLHKGPADENQLDETSRAYLMRMLDDATQNALLKQARMISGSLMPPALERNLSIRSDRQAHAAAEPRQTLNPPASPSLGLRQVSERLHRLNLHRSPSSSRAGHRRAAEEPAVLSRLPSNRSARTATVPPWHHPSREQHDPAASRPLLNLHHSTLSSRRVHGHAAEELAVLSRLASRRSSKTAMPAPRRNPIREQPDPAASHPPLLNLHLPTPSTSRDGRHGQSHRRRAAEEPVLSRLASIHSSKTAVPPPRYHPCREQPDYSSLNRYRLPLDATSQHGTVTGRSLRRTDLQDRTLPIYDPGESSLERGSMRRSVSRKLSLGRERPHGHATARGMAAEGSSSTRRLGRLGSGLSMGMASLRGSERAGRGVAMPTPRRYSSSASSNEAATIRSRITPHRREITPEHFPRRPEEGKLSTPRRQRREDDTAVSSVGSRPRRAMNRTNSSSTYTISSAAAASSFTYTGSTSTASSASASSYSSLPLTRRRGSPRPSYSSESSADSSRSRRRRQRDRERKERREGRLRRLKEKIAMVFHHRHDHHHHHHHHQQRGGQEGPAIATTWSDYHAVGNHKSAWKQLGGLFHRTKGTKEKKKTASIKGTMEKKAVSQTTAVSVAQKQKKRGRGGGMSVLLGGMRHLRRKQKEPASVKKMRKMATKVPGKNKNINWWKLLRKRRGKPQRRLGF